MNKQQKREKIDITSWGMEIYMKTEEGVEINSESMFLTKVVTTSIIWVK